MLREIIRMGDARLLRVAPPVEDLDSPALHALVADMFETMDAAGGVGLAAPQIAVDLQLMVFGFDSSQRYPDAPPVPRTALANAVIEPLSDELEDGWEGCLSIPGLRAVIPRYRRIRYRGVAPDASDRTRGRGLPCAGGAARARPPDRPAVSVADRRLRPVRLRGRAVLRAVARRPRRRRGADGDRKAKRPVSGPFRHTRRRLTSAP